MDASCTSRAARLATHYRNGIFAPSVLWEALAEALAECDVEATLDALPADLQRVLIDCALDRHGPHLTDDVSQGIAEWLQRIVHPPTNT